MYVFKASKGFSYSSDIKNHVSVSGGDFWKAETDGETASLRVFVNFSASTIDNVSLTIKSLNEHNTLSDLKCGYDPSSKMTLTDFFVCKGLNNTSDEIKDKTHHMTLIRIIW